ncbi:MAG TPA: hypothetical protein VHB79_08520 [Polyangiaceae bacterium]|nr:hypothetical protein [Polyangiaceae bacterium]
MSAVSRLGAFWGIFACGAFFGLAAGCKRSPPPTGAVPSAKASGLASTASSALSQPDAEAEPSHCRRLPGFELTLAAEASTDAKRRDSQEDEDDDALMPFGVDTGSAVAVPNGFAVAGIRGAGEAFVAVLGEQASRRVDLGELHGDAETPALSAFDERVLVALRSSDAAGFTIKLASVPLVGGDVEWGYELSKLGKAVTDVDVAVSGAHALLVFQADAKQGGPRLLVGSFAPATIKQPFEAKPLDVKDAEMPRVVARPGGFWLTWVRSLPEPKKPAGPRPASDAGAPDPEEREILEVGLRVVEVAKLDEQGKLVGAARRVGEPRRQVLLYDVAALASGGLLVATRSDSATPGAEGGALLLSEIGADGSVRVDQLEDEDIGVGAPTLLVDHDAKLPGPWLTLSAPNDSTRAGLAQGSQTKLQADPALGHAEIVAVSGGHFLAQRGRGRGIAFDALDCSWPSEPAPDKSPAKK